MIVEHHPFEILNIRIMQGDIWINTHAISEGMLQAWPVWSWRANEHVTSGDMVHEMVVGHAHIGVGRILDIAMVKHLGGQWRPLRLSGMNSKGVVQAVDMTAEHFLRVRRWVARECGTDRWSGQDVWPGRHPRAVAGTEWRPAIWGQIDQSAAQKPIALHELWGRAKDAGYPDPFTKDWFMRLQKRQEQGDSIRRPLALCIEVLDELAPPSPDEERSCNCDRSQLEAKLEDANEDAKTCLAIISALKAELGRRKIEINALGLQFAGMKRRINAANAKNEDLVNELNNVETERDALEVAVNRAHEDAEHPPTPSDLDRRIGRGLRASRVCRKIPFREVARRSGIEMVRLSQIERGRDVNGTPANPTTEEIDAIMRALMGEGEQDASRPDGAPHVVDCHPTQLHIHDVAGALGVSEDSLDDTTPISPASDTCSCQAKGTCSHCIRPITLPEVRESVARGRKRIQGGANPAYPTTRLSCRMAEFLLAEIDGLGVSNARASTEPAPHRDDVVIDWAPLPGTTPAARRSAVLALTEMDGVQWMPADEVTQERIDAWPVWQRKGGYRGITVVIRPTAYGVLIEGGEWRPLRMSGMSTNPETIGQIRAADMAAEYFDRVNAWQVQTPRDEGWTGLWNAYEFWDVDCDRKEGIFRPAVFGQIGESENRTVRNSRTVGNRDEPGWQDVGAIPREQRDEPLWLYREYSDLDPEDWLVVRRNGRKSNWPTHGDVRRIEYFIDPEHVTATPAPEVEAEPECECEQATGLRETIEHIREEQPSEPKPAKPREWDAYSVPRMLEILAEAAEHLLQDHDCDRDEWESVDAAARAAREWLAREVPQPEDMVEIRLPKPHMIERHLLARAIRHASLMKLLPNAKSQLELLAIALDLNRG